MKATLGVSTECQGTCVCVGGVVAYLNPRGKEADGRERFLKLRYNLAES